MWKRFAHLLHCPLCACPLDCLPIEEGAAPLNSDFAARGEALGIGSDVLARTVEAGLFLCGSCRTWFPLHHGLPILLPYATRQHRDFLALHGGVVRRLGRGARLPDRPPARGEEFVRESFSREWLDYAYDGVLWTWSYRDREELFLAEIGKTPPTPGAPTRFLEVGCGLGVVTSFAARHFPGDAVGMDLSLAAMRATRHFRSNPFVHFVQASLWNPPFARESFDLVYSHGVLHHTHSTEQALKAIAPYCRVGGRCYVWVYGLGSIREGVARRLAYAAESVLRPALAAAPPRIANAVLAPIACAYVGVNRLQRLAGSPRRTYTYERAFHAARDRFTPLYAERVTAPALARWFRETGFGHLHRLRPDEAPEATRETIQRNLGMRGVRTPLFKPNATRKRPRAETTLVPPSETERR